MEECKHCHQTLAEIAEHSENCLVEELETIEDTGYCIACTNREI